MGTKVMEGDKSSGWGVRVTVEEGVMVRASVLAGTKGVGRGQE